MSVPATDISLLATPVLAGLGTTTKQFSSCVLDQFSDDTLDSIFASGEMMAKYASKRAGIGLEIGRIAR
jgi:ribonucleoside-diphosphate reductase alpha chain